MNNPKTLTYLISLFDEFQLTELKGNFSTEIDHVKLKRYLSEVLDLDYGSTELGSVSLFLNDLSRFIHNNILIPRLEHRIDNLKYLGYINDTNLLNN